VNSSREDGGVGERESAGEQRRLEQQPDEILHRAVIRVGGELRLQILGEGKQTSNTQAQRKDEQAIEQERTAAKTLSDK